MPYRRRQESAEAAQLRCHAMARAACGAEDGGVAARLLRGVRAAWGVREGGGAGRRREGTAGQEEWGRRRGGALGREWVN